MKQRPSIRDLFATTGTIESLAEMRAEMLRALAAGEIAPSDKTLLEWHEAIWVRVAELMTLRPREAAFIFNLTLRWPKPPGLEDGLRQAVAELMAPLPTPAEEERWLERCAARLHAVGGLDPAVAFSTAESQLENLNGDLSESPEEAADDEMSYWGED